MIVTGTNQGIVAVNATGALLADRSLLGTSPTAHG